MTKGTDNFLAISGGIGGAKLALGLHKVLPPGQFKVLANTGDDFEHLGLSISPDIDTLLYTLSGLNNEELGWGRRDESWNFLEACKQLQLESWFQLGDRDLALHIYRTQQLAAGFSLTNITQSLCEKLDISTPVLPMTDSPVRTMLDTDHGQMAFQEYFVKHRCEPVVKEIWYQGADSAAISKELEKALQSPELGAVIICPSNPFLSIEPVLATADLRERLRTLGKPVLLVSPIIDGKSIKGPTAKLMQELKMPTTVASIAEIYRGLATHIIIDEQDVQHTETIMDTGMKVLTANILMNDLQDKMKLAEIAIDFARH